MNIARRFFISGRLSNSPSEMPRNGVDVELLSLKHVFLVSIS